MSEVFEIPLKGANQKINIAIADISYNMRFIYCQTLDDNASWLLDISDENDLPLACGIPLVTGVDLLGQYRYLFGFILYCFTDGNRDAVPIFANLGTTSHLFLEVQ